MSPPSECIIKSKRILRPKNGGNIVVYVDVFEIIPFPQDRLILEKYKISWVAFDSLTPEMKIVIDSHAPKCIHYHGVSEEERSIEVKTLEEALLFFEREVEKWLGELEEKIYENFYF